ncbi:MAG TPA: addiction module protein [Polyangiaceae bacterium]|nr:addiction module protein [Polyangiaceae bacterium]
MSPRVHAVLNLVAQMTNEERNELHDELERCSPEEWSTAWNDELADRMAQVERGEVQLLTRDELFADEPRR